MPPVANEFAKWVRARLDKNKQDGEKPDSWLGLALVLAEQTGRTQKSWDEQLGTYRRARDPITPRERTLDEIANALGVSRSEIPVDRLTSRQILEAVERVEAKLDGMEQSRAVSGTEIGRSFAALGKTLARLEHKVDQLPREGEVPTEATD